MSGAGITKRVLADAMKKFMCERPLSKISVGDIVEECGLNRNSFYYHFKDKYDLVNWIFYTELVAELGSRDADTGWEMLEQILRFFYENREFYLSAFSETGQNSFSEYFLQTINAAVLARSDEMFAEDEDREFYVAFFADAFLATVTRWLRQGAKTPPEKLAALIEKAASGAAVRALDRVVPR